MDAENVSVVVQLQNPTKEVISLVENFPLKNKSVFIIEKDFMSTTAAINNNVFSGICNAFTKLDAEYCLILEDDIVLMPTAMQYLSLAFEKYGKAEKFRGVNCFSKMSLRMDSSFLVAKSNYGFAWGWAIDRRTFLELTKFWNGLENDHWDFLVEPFVRTGFVINPFASQVLNIGFDETATHSSQDQPLGEEMLISTKSWMKEITAINESKEYKFEWREGFYDLQFLNRLDRIKLSFLTFLVFRISLLEKRFSSLEIIRVKLIGFRPKI